MFLFRTVEEAIAVYFRSEDDSLLSDCLGENWVVAAVHLAADLTGTYASYTILQDLNF